MPLVVGCRRSHICNPTHNHPTSKFWIYTSPSLPRHHHKPTGAGVAGYASATVGSGQVMKPSIHPPLASKNRPSGVDQSAS